MIVLILVMKYFVDFDTNIAISCIHIKVNKFISRINN